MIYLLIILLPVSVYCANSSSTYNCSSFISLSPEQLWQAIQLPTFDRYFLMIGGCLSIICLIVTALTWSFYKSFSPPSDIMLIIIIAQTIQNSSLVASAVYFTIYNNTPNNPVPLPASLFNACYAIGTFNILGYLTSTMYNMSFCVILAYSIRNTLKGSFIKQWWYHSISGIVIVSLVIINLATGNVGRSSSGICGFKASNRQSIIRSILELLICFVCLFSMYHFRLRIPKNSYFQKQSIFGYYYYYMGLYAFVQFSTTIIFLVGDIDCTHNTASIPAFTRVTFSIGNATYLILSFVILFMRFSHPILRLKLKSIFLSPQQQLLMRNDSKPDGIELQSPKRSFQEGNDDIIDPIINDENISWLGSLLQSIKGSQILSFLTGITLGYIEMQSSYSANRLLHPSQTSHTQINELQEAHQLIDQSFEEEERPWERSFKNRQQIKRNYVVLFDENLIDQYILRRVSDSESLLVKKKLDGLRTLSYEMTLFYPQLYIELLNRQPSQDLLASFNIKRNISHVKRESYANGGKSGQFFYCTYNNSYVFKTIKKYQAECCIQKSYAFYNYLRNNPESLIVKILGLYKFNRKDIKQEPIHLILMRNVSRSSREKIFRVYDIKGSRYNRSTIQDKNIKKIDETLLRKYTLKDKDFLLLQDKVHINAEAGKALKYMLKKDIQFLIKQKVMDYSLLIIRRKGTKKTNSVYQLPSTKQTNEVYNFGIIDYLESWNFKRKAERVIKTLMTDQEVTADSPSKYGKRLINFIEQIM